MNKINYYGPYDCVPNALLYLLDQYDFPLDPVYMFNWDILYDNATDRFSGSAEAFVLFEFVRAHYHIRINEISFEDIRTTKGHFLIVLSLFDLPYSKFFQMFEQSHCLVARYIKSDQVLLIDPYFGEEIVLSLGDCYHSWSKFRDWIYIWEPTNEFIPTNKYISPYITSQNYEKSYDRALRFAEDMANVHEDHDQQQLLVNKYFGMLYSIYISRKNHIMSVNKFTKEGDTILSGWVDMQKRFLKLQDRPDSKIHLAEKMTQVFDLEKQFINKLDELQYRTL